MTFLQTVAETLIRQGWENLRNYTLIFPMQRAGVYFQQCIRDAMIRQGYAKPVVLPRTMTIDQLVDELSELRLTDEIRAVCRLYAIHRQRTKAPLSLDVFYGFGKQLLQDFNSIDMALQDTRKVISNLTAALRLDEMDLDEQTRQNLLHLVNLNHPDERIQAFFHELWEQLPAIYDTFSAAQAEQGVGTKGACYRNVIDHFEDLFPRLEGRTMVFVGFNYLLPAERRLMALLQEHRSAMFFWDDDPSFTIDESVYKFIRENVLQFGNAFKPDSTRKEAKPVSAIVTMSNDAQIQYVGEWVNLHLGQDKRLAVVVPNESVLDSVIYALPASLSCSSETPSPKVNITKGYPLKNTNIYADVMRYLSDKQNDRQEHENWTDVLERLLANLPEPLVVADGAARWQDILQQEAYVQMQIVIQRFITLFKDGVLVDVSRLSTLRNLMRRILDAVSIPFHGEPLAQVQVIGVLETRLLDFDAVLVLNVEEGVVPASTHDNSFIPFDLRKAYRMQTHDEESKVYAYNFFRLLRRAGVVTLMYSEATAEMTKKSMSRFLMQLLLSPDISVTKYRLVESLHPSFSEAAQSILHPRGGGSFRPSKLSPSALSDYIECPREFYWKHVERVPEPEGNNRILAPNELGSLFHGAVKHAFEVIGGREITAVTPVPDDCMKAYIDAACWDKNSEEAIDAGYSALISDYDKHHDSKIGAELYHKEQHRAENEVVRTMLRNVLEAEIAAQHQLRIVRQEGEYRLAFRVNGYDEPVWLGGYIDRLDIIHENGRDCLRVLDYKTGSYKEDKLSVQSLEDLSKKPEKRYVLQTLIYSAVCAELQGRSLPDGYPVMPQLMFTQRAKAASRVKIGQEAVTDIRPLLPDLYKQLGDIIAAILSEPQADHPWRMTDEITCGNSFCPFHLLCGRERLL